MQDVQISKEQLKRMNKQQYCGTKQFFEDKWRNVIQDRCNDSNRLRWRIAQWIDELITFWSALALTMSTLLTPDNRKGQDYYLKNHTYGGIHEAGHSWKADGRLLKKNDCSD